MTQTQSLVALTSETQEYPSRDQTHSAAPFSRQHTMSSRNQEMEEDPLFELLKHSNGLLWINHAKTQPQTKDQVAQGLRQGIMEILILSSRHHARTCGPETTGQNQQIETGVHGQPTQIWKKHIGQGAIRSPRVTNRPSRKLSSQDTRH